MDVPVYMELPAGVSPVDVQMKFNAIMFSNLIKVYMDLSKWATIGLRSFGRFKISFRVKLTGVCSFGKIALFSLTLMTALFLGR